MDFLFILLLGVHIYFKSIKNNNWEVKTLEK